MAKFYHPFKLRQQPLIVAVVMGLYSGLNLDVRSQTAPSPEMNLCFDQIETLPSPPLSQTQPSIPSLWLAQDLYGQTTQRQPQAKTTDADLNQAKDNTPPLNLTQSNNQLLKTWFVQDQESTLVTPDIVVNHLATLVVDRQQWQTERYLGQYVFLNRFGTVAKGYGYNIRVCNTQGDLLAYHICDFQTAPLECQIFIRSEGFGLRDFKVFETDTP